MTLSFISFFISQIVLVPVFLVTTKKLFKPNMGALGYVSYFFISPYCVYLYSILAYGLISTLTPDNALFNELASYADFFALLVSFLFAAIYQRSIAKKHRAVGFFIYISFYMIGMVFSLVYPTPVTNVLFSIVVPIVTTFLMYRFITLPFAEISNSEFEFHTGMLFLPITAEAMLVLRFFLNIVSYQDKYLGKYDTALMIYSTIFGYIILIYLFLITGMVTKDIKQIETIQSQQDDLLRDNERIKKITIESLMALVGTIEAKDEYTNGHSLRVAEYSKMIAIKLGYDEDAATQIYQVALLHDIGKIAVPDEIINKPGKLTEDEYLIIKEHTKRGYDILQTIEELPDLRLGALYHHECWDGSGYPLGIAETDIPEVARIISVADAYDAMTSRRSYRPAMDQKSARAEIANGIGTQFFPAAAQAMLDIIDSDMEYEFRQHE